MPSFRTLRWSLALVFVLGPPYLFETLAEHFYLLHSNLFFIFSGQRFYFDVYYLAFAGGVLGYKSRNLVRGWLAYFASITILMTLFFSACDPILCYSTGIDGLEPLRMGSFFIAIGIATSYLGDRRSGFPNTSNTARLLAGGCAFYAVAYVPVIFTIAGATILAPVDGFALPALLTFLSFAVVLSFGEGAGIKTWFIPVASQAALLLIGSGIARQYYSEVLTIVAVALIATAGGAGGGALILARSTRFSSRFRRSRLPFTGVVVFVVLASLIVWPDAVVGQVVSASNAGVPANYSYVIPDSAGGFMSSPMVRPSAVRVNVTFAHFDVSSVQVGGFLAGGIGVHSADCCTDGIDYGYRFDAILYGNGSETLSASAWKVCDANAACGGHSWRLLMFFVSRPLSRAALEEQLQLTLRWQNHTVIWEYGLGGRTYQLGAFVASGRANSAFNAGWLGPPVNPSPGGAFFFQFGVSKTGQMTGPWSVSFDCPSIFWNGTWSCINHAESLQGDQSFWKVLWRWGESFRGVEAQADPSLRSVTFHGSNSTMCSFVGFW